TGPGSRAAGPAFLALARAARSVVGAASGLRLARLAGAKLPWPLLARIDPAPAAVTAGMGTGQPPAGHNSAPGSDDPQRPRISGAGQGPDHDHQQGRTKPGAPGRLPGGREPAMTAAHRPHHGGRKPAAAAV